MKKFTKININTKNPKPSAAAQFQVCRVKREWRAMGGGVGVGWMTWQRWWDRAFANTSRGMGLGAKRPKPSTVARFWVCRIKREWRVMGRGVEVGWMRWHRWWDHAFAYTSRGMGLGAKRPKPSAAAQFWVFRVEREWRAMGGGVGVEGGGFAYLGTCIPSYLSISFPPFSILLP